MPSSYPHPDGTGQPVPPPCPVTTHPHRPIAFNGPTARQPPTPAPTHAPTCRSMSMDLGDPWILLSGLLIGGLGVVLFMYGKKQVNVKCLAAGAVLCVFP